MYINPAFKTDEDEAWAFVEERGFGAVVALDAGTPLASHVPLLVIRDAETGARRLQFHVARPNPLHSVLAQSPRIMVIVSGPDAYISPDWYVSDDQVPTWNYIAAHIVGTARAMTPDEAHAHVEAMSLAFERRLLPKKPWSTSKMTEQKLAMMLRAIVPVEVSAENIECSFKLSQNKSEGDRLEAAHMLDWRGSPNEKAVAAAMRARLKRVKDEG